MACFGDGREYILLPCRHDYWRHWHLQAEESRFAVRRSRHSSIVLQLYREVLPPLVFYVDMPRPNRSECQQDYAVNLRLFDLGGHLDADWVWQFVYEYLSQLNSEAEISPPVSGREKIGNKDLDVRYLFRPHMKRKKTMIYLQISTAQGPAECRIFARFVLERLLREAERAGVGLEILEETADKNGVLSAVLKLCGNGARELAARWEGTLQWVCSSPLRTKHPRKNWYIGVFRLPEMPMLPDNSGIEFQVCRAGGKGGQHVNKTESAVRAVHLASGLSVRVESERSQHANKKRALELLALKLADQHQSALSRYAVHAHKSLYRVERGNPARVFKGREFDEC